MTAPVDRATLEKAIQWLGSESPKVSVLLAAARAHLDTLPKTKTVEVHFVARLSHDGAQVHYCQTDTPDNRDECDSLVIIHGGQMVYLTGMAQVPS